MTASDVDLSHGGVRVNRPDRIEAGEEGRLHPVAQAFDD